MKKRQYKIKSFIKNLDNNKHWYIISIAFDNSSFFKRLNNINDFYKRLSNSKASITGHSSNRSWWKRIAPSGIYEQILNDDILMINFIMTTDSKINELEFKSRTKKICPYIYIKIGFQEKEELDKLTSSTYFSYQQNIELFGDAKKERDNNIYI
jgi:hypothetical protein